MATYVSREQLQDYLRGDPDGDLPTDDGELDEMILRAEALVDQAVGGGEIAQPGSGAATPTWTLRRFDPATLNPAQRMALARATAAAVQWELSQGLDLVSGGAEFGPGEVVILNRPAVTPPRMLRELAGFGLIRRSGCVQSDEAA